jgi:hypothetical protein
MAKHRKLSLKQRNQIADKLMTWANMVFAGMVLAQVLSKPFSIPVALVGVASFVGAYVFAVAVMRGGERQ